MSDAPTFMPKGYMIAGGVVSYQNLRFYDFNFAIIEDMNINAFNLKASPFVYFTVGKNMAVGARFTYRRAMGKVDETKLALSPDLSFEIKDFYAITHNYLGSVAFRYYIPFGSSKRFAMFTDVALTGGYGQGKSTSGKGDNLTGTYSTSFQLSFDATPGVVVFLSNEIAVEISLEVFSIGYKRTTQIRNQVDKGTFENAKGSLTLNVLTVNIGVQFAIPLKSDKKSVK